MPPVHLSPIRRCATSSIVGPLLALSALVAGACSDGATNPVSPAVAAVPAFAKNTGGSKQRILFTSARDGNYEIYSMNPDGSEATRLTNDPAVDLMGAWSPDGRRIAFTSARDNPLGDLYTMNADGTGIVRLTFGPGASGLASWSKDGEKLVFVSSRDGADPAANDDTGNELYTMNADGSGVTRLTFNATVDATPAWSPDGNRIAFTSGRDHAGTDATDLYTMNVDGTGVTRLTSQNATLEYPSWDPHGRRIAFSNASVAGHDVYVIRFDGTGLTRLTFGGPGGGNLYPTWSPDGNKIAFASGRDGDPELYSMNADGTGQTRLTNSPGDDLVARWSR